MIYELFDWKIKTAIVLAILCALTSVVLAIKAWGSPAVTDSLSAVNMIFAYRYALAFFSASYVFSASARKLYKKRLRLCF